VRKQTPAAARAVARVMSAPSGAVLGMWTRRALCAQEDPEVFFPPKGDTGIQAKQICAQCPVHLECLDYAIAADERHGIWGGLNRAERLRARHSKEATRSRGREVRLPPRISYIYMST